MFYQFYGLANTGEVAQAILRLVFPTQPDQAALSAKQRYNATRISKITVK